MMMRWSKPGGQSGRSDAVKTGAADNVAASGEAQQEWRTEDLAGSDTRGRLAASAPNLPVLLLL